MTALFGEALIAVGLCRLVPPPVAEAAGNALQALAQRAGKHYNTLRDAIYDKRWGLPSSVVKRSQAFNLRHVTPVAHFDFIDAIRKADIDGVCPSSSASSTCSPAASSASSLVSPLCLDSGWGGVDGEDHDARSVPYLLTANVLTPFNAGVDMRRTAMECVRRIEHFDILALGSDTAGEGGCDDLAARGTPAILVGLLPARLIELIAMAAGPSAATALVCAANCPLAVHAVLCAPAVDRLPGGDLFDVRMQVKRKRAQRKRQGWKSWRKLDGVRSPLHVIGHVAGLTALRLRVLSFDDCIRQRGNHRFSGRKLRKVVEMIVWAGDHEAVADLICGHCNAQMQSFEAVDRCFNSCPACIAVPDRIKQRQGSVCPIFP
mmetsp:Transcript_99013/g.295773  ORF Transcript_99013/g.295773 Transcript_99013/m.295773 type:complete len:376 (-) Transcript_99013:78-1205(-)